MRDLRLGSPCQRPCLRNQLLEDFSSTENHAQGVLQVVRDSAKDLALEAVGLAQPRPLRRESAVRSGEVLGTLGHALLQPGIGALQLLVENDVVECDGKSAAENLDQCAVRIRKLACRLEHHDDLAAAERLDIENGALETRGGGA